MNEHECFVHRLFSRIAIRYDWMNKIISFNMDKSWRRHTIDLAEPLLGQQWLDVCSGTGKLALGLADRVGATGRVVGLDFNADMLAVARKNEQFQRGAVSVEWIEGNAMQMPFSNDYFDGATIGFGLRNLPDLSAGLAEMLRVVKPGGKIVILDASHPVWPFFRPSTHRPIFDCRSMDFSVPGCREELAQNQPQRLLKSLFRPRRQRRTVNHSARQQ